MRAFRPRLQHRFEVGCGGSENLERANVVAAADQHRHVPPGHDAVVDPTAGGVDRIEHRGRDDIEPVPHVGMGCGLVAASSRPSESAYPLNTSVSGIEGSSNHKVSIPLMKARISTALVAASKSLR